MRSWAERVHVGVFATCIVALLLLCLVITPTVDAAINQQINFQGKLTNPDGTNVANGNYSIVFSMYTVASAGTAVWTETQSSVAVTDGIFQVSLGSVTALPGSVDFNSSSIYLGIKVGADPEMSPRVRFTAAPYAFNADKLNGLSSSAFAQLGSSNVFTGTNTIQGSSASQLVVQNGTRTVLQVDTSTERVAIGPAAVAANGALTIGTNTTAASGGLYFGTDTNLYRSAAGVLRTDSRFVLQGTVNNASALIVNDKDGNNVFSVDTDSGTVHAPGAGGIQFGESYFTNISSDFFIVNPAGNIRMTIAGKVIMSVGNFADAFTVGGTTGLRYDSINKRLNIAGNAGTDTLNVNGSQSIIGGTLRVQNTGTGAAMLIDRTDGVIGSMKAGAAKIGYFFDDTGSFSIAKDTRANITAGTGSGTDLMTVLASGNIGIGDTTPAATLTVGDGEKFTVDGATGNMSTQGTAGIAGALTANGAVLFKNTANSSSAFQVQSAGVSGISVFDVDTSALRVQLGNSTTDGNAVTLVLDSYNVATDPTGVNGATYYNTALGKFRCYEGSAWKNCITSETATRSFIDTTADTFTIANTTTTYWDPAAQNNSTYPNITPSKNTKSVWVTFSVEFRSSSANDNEFVARVERSTTATVANCGSGTTIGTLGTFASTTGVRKSATLQMMDSVATTGKVWYNICSDTTGLAAGGTVNQITATLMEVDNSIQ